MLYYIFQTAFGYTGVAGSERGISLLELPHPSFETAKARLESLLDERAEYSGDYFSEMAERVAAYFEGCRVQLEFPLDLSGYGLFDLSVWDAARKIPYGETRSYSWIADRIGKKNACRAVGQAMGRNPVPLIIPCHRVVRMDGGLGGFGAGIEWKRRLLDLESG